MLNIIFVLLFLTAPAGVLWLCGKSKFLGKIGAMLTGVYTGGTINLAGELNTMAYLAMVIFCSLFMQVILAKIFKLDADTTVISSVSFICSPPFVPMIAGAMKNKKVLAAGLAIGVFGYAAGNYLGFLIFRLLS